jgi:hypothetical protein
MTAISDGVVIGIVLGLVFAAVSYYLYSRQSQLERKVSLMENILLDLKVTTEQTLLSATEAPDTKEAIGPVNEAEEQNMNTNMYRDIMANNSEDEDGLKTEDNSETRDVTLDSMMPRSRSSPQNIQVEKDKASVSSNYEAMTYKELVQIARQKGISGLRNMSKAQVIDALRGNTGTSSSLANWTVNDSESTPIENLGSAMDINNGEVIASLESGPESSLVSSE